MCEKLDGNAIAISQHDMENVVGIVVNLSFDKEIAEKLKQAGVVDKVKVLPNFETCTGPASAQVEQALWLLEPPKQPGAYAAKAEQGRDAKETGAEKHVMISYSWAQKPLALKLNEYLKSKDVKVWIDVEQMAGSVLEAMADAVENSSAVLICISQRYKESSNCQIESEYVYVFQLKKPFLPVLAKGITGRLAGLAP